MYVPKHTSWLNQVEIGFRVWTRRVLKRGDFRSIPVEIPLRMTGTDGDSGVVPGVVSGGIRPHRNAPMCTSGAFGGGSDNPHETQEMKGAGASQHRPAPTRIKLPGMDSNHDEEYQKLLCYRYTTG